MDLRISLIAPVFQGADVIDEFHRQVTAVLEQLGVQFEILFVDDASPDRSWEVICRLAQQDPRVSGIRLAHNVRQTRAIFAGVAAAEPGNHILVMDSDLGDPPKAIPEMVRNFLLGHDLVVARRERNEPSLTRRIGSRSLNVVARGLRVPVADVGSSFLLVDRCLARPMTAVMERSGTHLILPDLVSMSRSPTTVRVESQIVSPTGYDRRAILSMGMQFARTYLFRRLAVVVGVLAAMAFSSLPVLRSRRTRRVGLIGGTLACATAALLRLASARQRPVGGPIFDVSEVVGPIVARRSCVSTEG